MQRAGALSFRMYTSTATNSTASPKQRTAQVSSSAMQSSKFQIRLQPRLWVAVVLLALALGAAACSSGEAQEATTSADLLPPAAPLAAELSAPPAAEPSPVPDDALTPPPAQRPLARDSIPMEAAFPPDPDGPDDYDYEDEEELALALDALRNPDPLERSDAVLDIDPEGRGLPYLLEVLSDDSDPEVRIAVVSKLGYTESPEAIAGLVSALNDRDPEVVLEAIDALELSADHTVIGSLGKLFQHPDPDVWEAAQDAIGYLDQ